MTPIEGFLISALLYQIVLLLMHWDKYQECQRPIQLFLLMDYVIIIAFRVLWMMQKAYPEWEDRFTKLTHGLFVFFFGWTIMGTSWFHVSKQCLPDSKEYWMFMTWIIFSYIWISFYALLAGLRYFVMQQQFQANAYERGDDRGLSDIQLETIPSTILGTADVEVLSSKVCSICLEEFVVTENVKRIPVCSHTFHSDCIDDWLLRRNTCPLCRHAICDGQGRLIPPLNQTDLPAESGQVALMVGDASSTAAPPYASSTAAPPSFPTNATADIVLRVVD